MPKADIGWVLDCTAQNVKRYGLYRSYYDGDHQLLFATEKFRNTFGNLFQSFADNLCPPVVDALTDRLEITGFDGKAAERADAIWDEARGDRVALQVHDEAAQVGDGYVVVWPDAQGTPQFWSQDPECCCVDYDNDQPGKIVKAGKAWVQSDGLWRVTLYYDDHNERYISTRKLTARPRTERAFVAYSGDEAGPEVPNKWGIVPMFHFANDAGLGELGRSELRDIVPLQDALNKSVCDMLVAMEFAGFPQRWATGLQIEIDPDTGRPKETPFTPGVDRVWTGADTVKFGQFDSTGSLVDYIAVQTSLREEIARISGTPLHLLMLASNYPSGEGLKIAEGRLVRKVAKRQTVFGDVWEDAIACAMAMKGEPLAAKADLATIWLSAAPHNPLLDAETQLVKQQVGVSQEQSLAELGYDAIKVQEMLKANADAAQAEADLALQGATGVVSAFTRNGSPGEASTPGKPQGSKAGPNSTQGPATGLKRGTQPALIRPSAPRAGRGEYDQS